MWFLTHGEFPRAQEAVCHECDVRLCVNPNHLWLGTWLDNLLDMHKKGRGRCGVRFGAANHKTKLTVEAVQEIKKELSNGASLAALGRRYNVAPQSISAIKSGKNWRNV